MADNPRPVSFNNSRGCVDSGAAEWLRFAACFSNASPRHSGSTPSSSTATELKLMPLMSFVSTWNVASALGNYTIKHAYHGHDKYIVCDTDVSLQPHPGSDC